MSSDMRPKVSVIIPTKDRLELLKRSVASVLHQTFANFELYIVNDGSSDGTAQFLSELCIRDSRVKTLDCERSVGAARARNLAINLARGEYICFLDDDDEWYAAKLHRQLLVADKGSMVGCLSRRVDGYIALGTFRLNSKDKEIQDFDAPVKTKAMSLNDIFLNNGRITPSSVMIKRDILLSCKGFDESLVASQGRDLFVRIVNRFGPALLIEEQLTKHFQRHGLVRISTTRNHLIGAWDEFHKHRDLMPNTLVHWRLFVLYMREAAFSNSFFDTIKWTLRAMGQYRGKRTKAHLKVFFTQLLLK